MVEGDDSVLAEAAGGQLAPEKGVVEDIKVGNTSVVAFDVVPDFDVLLLGQLPGAH